MDNSKRLLFIALALSLVSQPTSVIVIDLFDDEEQKKLLQEFLKRAFFFVLLRMISQPIVLPLLELEEDEDHINTNSIIELLFPDWEGRASEPRDVWETLSRHFFFFFSFFFLASQHNLCSSRFPPLFYYMTGETPADLVLMVFIWLRKYGTLTDLSSLFGVSVPTASNDVHHIIPILRVHLQHHIRWPSLHEFEQLPPLT
jgi:hypothetical protein